MHLQVRVVVELIHLLYVDDVSISSNYKKIGECFVFFSFFFVFMSSRLVVLLLL